MSNPKMPDLNALMRQAQKLQTDVAKAQEEVAAIRNDDGICRCNRLRLIADPEA